MTVTLQTCQALISSLGYELTLDDAVLRPGQERLSVIAFLTERLVHPVPLAHLFSRLDELQPQSRLAEEERHAQRYVGLLKQVGVPTMLDHVRGCVPTQNSLAFLHKLATLVQLKEGKGTGPAPAPGPHGSQPCSHPPDFLGSYAPLLDFACSNVAQLTAESSQLLPSDIAKATAKHSALADHVLSSSREWARQLGESTRALRCDVESTSSQVSWADAGAWQQQLGELGAQLQHFLQAMDTFAAVYAKELGVWCDSLPETRLHGLGQQSASLLADHRLVTSVLQSIETIRVMHAAITRSAPPLLAHQPQALLRIAEGAQREAAQLARQVSVLHKAIELQESLGARQPQVPLPVPQPMVLNGAAMDWD